MNKVRIKIRPVVKSNILYPLSHTQLRCYHFAKLPELQTLLNQPSTNQPSDILPCPLNYPLPFPSLIIVFPMHTKFRNTWSLRLVNAGMAAKIVSGKASHRIIDHVFGAKQLDTH